jgi:hypothetical protein
MESLCGKKRAIDNSIVIPIALYPKVKPNINIDIFEPRPELRIATESSLGHINKYRAIENNSKTEK